MRVHHVFCNVCGKELDALDKQQKFGYHQTLVYGSKYDGTAVDLDLCCNCIDKLLGKIAQKGAFSPISESCNNQ